MSRLIHGMKNTPEYKTWAEAKRRCHNPDCAAYKDYGARGITMCEEWRTNFQAFFDYIGPRPTGHEIDRIDNDKGYQPGNGRWATKKENVRNRRVSVRVEYEGSLISLKEYSERKGIAYKTAWARVRKYPAMLHGERDKKLGEVHPQAKLKNDEVVAIRASTESTKNLAAKYSVSESWVRSIRNGKKRTVL